MSDNCNKKKWERMLWQSFLLTCNLEFLSTSSVYNDNESTRCRELFKKSLRRTWRRIERYGELFATAPPVPARRIVEMELENEYQN